MVPAVANVVFVAVLNAVAAVIAVIIVAVGTFCHFHYHQRSCCCCNCCRLLYFIQTDTCIEKDTQTTAKQRS